MKPHSRPHKQVIVALGLPLNSEGQVLLTRRNDPHTPSAHGKWQITGGGVEFGESLELALIREIKEELGVSARILIPEPMVRSSVWNLSRIDVQVILVCYLISIANAPIKPSTREIAGYGWYHPNKVSKLDTLPQVKEFVTRASFLIMKYDLTSLVD